MEEGRRIYKLNKPAPATHEPTWADWLAAIMATFGLPVLLPVLSLYNFARGRRTKGKFYLAFFGLTIVLVLVMRSALGF